jgi:3-methyladenine DNA glycosylase AlkC
MAEPLKNIYNRSFFDNFFTHLPEVTPSVFLEKIYNEDWEQRELKQRMRHIAETLGALLPNDFVEAIRILRQCVDKMRNQNRSEMNFGFMFLPDFIEVFGLAHFEVSVEAMTDLTQFTSCEFAVRPFLIQYGDQMMQQMYVWSNHPHPMVRRLASEGTRPRLPWAMAVPMLKKDPSPILPILETLKNDPSETVRRSVANNLNDIAKDHPDFVLNIMQNWRNVSPETDWVIRHGSRTLLKRANPKALQNFGFQEVIPVEVTDFAIDKNTLKIGEVLTFTFSIKNLSDTEGYKVRLEYGIDYMKANGKTSRKIFQISETTFEQGKTRSFIRQQSFKNLTTRKHYSGEHRLAIIVNGHEKACINFYLHTQKSI